MKNTIRLYELLVISANKGLQLLQQNGAMPSGHNGPYNDPETSVRNTSHWLIIFLKALEISADKQFEDAAIKCLKYIMSSDARPHGFTFWHRTKKGKDSTNGVIGQAWGIEALVEAYKVFGEKEIISLALDLFNLHPYDEKLNGWKIVDIDGKHIGFDYTFNHQLWFAATGVLLEQATGKLLRSVQSFLEALPRNLQIYPDGIIKHVPTLYLKHGMIEKIKASAFELKHRLDSSKHLYYKSVGYHGFNLYALSIIDETVPSLEIFEVSKVKKAMSVLEMSNFGNNLEKSKYGYPYNPAGIELAYACQRVAKEKESKLWIQQQFDRTFDLTANLMIKGKPFDVNTAAARLYEAVRLKDAEIVTDGRI
ncbi:hypothetical protein [Parapedobacter sp. 10938]|uniref:hypothetical protein n=1 Tax=Parapedobacter flavus TaxID=3110225 RepID=UPI002DB75BEE|nr:hypothetical protein [Parapedobacter sp. 10938]MEC3880164.1 hypothetical protein [Parapedobacter sp. 10938]